MPVYIYPIVFISSLQSTGDVARMKIPRQPKLPDHISRSRMEGYWNESCYLYESKIVELFPSNHDLSIGATEFSPLLLGLFVYQPFICLSCMHAQLLLGNLNTSSHSYRPGKVEPNKRGSSSLSDNSCIVKRIEYAIVSLYDERRNR